MQSDFEDIFDSIEESNIITESGRKSRGGLKSLSELSNEGVQKVDGALLSPTFKSKVTFAFDSFTFNSDCVRLFEKVRTQHIELIMDKPAFRLIILPSSPKPKDSVKFALDKDGMNKPRKIIARKFCALLYNFTQWTPEHRYRIMAIHQELEGQELIVFNLDEAVEVRSTTVINDNGKKKTTREIFLPVKFMDGNFGDEYSESAERNKVDLSDMFMFVDPKTGEYEERQIEPRVPDAETVIRGNYRPKPDAAKKRKVSKAKG